MTTYPGPLTAEQISRHIGEPRSIRWIELSSMKEHGQLSCIDGRDERGIIGSPGGDSGLFLLTLAAIEETTGRRLNEETVIRGLHSHLDTFGHLYIHTDAQAMGELIEALKADPRLQTAAVGDLAAEDWLEGAGLPGRRGAGGSGGPAGTLGGASEHRLRAYSPHGTAQ